MLDAILDAKKSGPLQIWGRLGGMRRASGEIIEGYENQGNLAAWSRAPFLVGRRIASRIPPSHAIWVVGW